MRKEQNNRFPGGRAYYASLVVCVCALGVSGYLYATGRGAARLRQEQPVLATQDQPVSLQEQERPTAPVRPAQPEKPTLPPRTEPPEPQRLKTARPLEGQILSEYAVECLGYNETTRDWRTHPGIDIGAEAGAAVCCAADGEVYTVYDDERLGTTVVVRHAGGYVTTYASLAPDPEVRPGDAVTMGQKLGCVGSTAQMEVALGDHLHFSVTKNDVPVDPEEFFAG